MRKWWKRQPKRDWTTYPGELITDKALNAADDRNYAPADDVLAMVDADHRARIKQLERRVRKLEGWEAPEWKEPPEIPEAEWKALAKRHMGDR